MVTGVEEYFKILEELQKNNTTLPINIQSGESFFDVDLNDRLIIVPPEFKKYIAVQRDHNIETIYFRVDRYFDTTDLSELTCVVQFTNARKESGIHLVSEKDLTTYSSDGKMILGWKLNRDFTQYPGTVTYSLRFYKLDENKKFIYDLHTIPAIGIIAPGLDTLADTNAEEDTRPVANLITDLIDRVDYACGPEMNGMMKNNIRDYFVENPVEEDIKDYLSNHQVVSDDKVDNAVHDYLTANPPTGGATNVQVEEAVNNYLNNNDNSELVKQSNAIGYYYEGFVAPSTNIFDKTKIFENQTIQKMTGRKDETLDNSDIALGNAFTDSTRLSVTKQKFKCKQGDVINISHDYMRIVFYNTDGVVVEGMGDNTDKTFIAPEDSDYFRVSMLTAIIDTFMISQNKDLPTTYESYEVGNEGIKTYNSVPKLKDRVEKLEKNQDSGLVSKVENLETIILPKINDRLEALETKSIFDKGAIVFSFDAMAENDKRIDILSDYGFVANGNTGNYTGFNQSKVNLVKQLRLCGWDISTYSAIDWVYAVYGEACLSDNISEEIQEAWNEYVRKAVENEKLHGIFNPISWACRQSKYCKGLENALKKYGYKMARGSYTTGEKYFYYDSEFRKNIASFSIYPNTVTSAKNAIDYAAKNKVGVVLFSHQIFDTVDEANSNYGTTEDVLKEICDYVRAYVDDGKLDVLTFRDIYAKYYPDESKELDYNRIMATIAYNS